MNLNRVGLTILLAFFFSVGLQNALKPTPQPVDQPPVFSVAWSPDGKQIAIGTGGMGCSSRDNAIDIIDAITGLVTLQLLGHTCEVNSVAWNADGTKLASASADGISRVWNTKTGEILSESELFVSGRYRVAWSPNGDQLADIVAGDAGVEILDSITASRSSYLCCVPGPARDVVWSPDGAKLAIAGDVVEVWDVQREQSLMSFGDESNPAITVAWKPDSSEIAVGYKDGDIVLWDTSTGKRTNTFKGHTDPVTEVRWETSGVRLASSSLDGTVRVWDTVTNQQLEKFSSPKGEDIFSVDWNPDGSQLVYGGYFYDSPRNIIIVSTTQP